MWAAVSVSGLIGPYFFHKDGSNITVNQYTYQDFIRWFICQLKLRNKFSKAILMQDGATPHTALSTRTFLRQQFKDRIIAKEWPAQSPDLTPADYYLWPQLKSRMYQGQHPFKSIRSLKRAITHHTNKLIDANRGHLVDSVLDETLYTSSGDH